MVGKIISHYKIIEKHPAEQTFHQMLKEIASLLEKCESQYLDEEEREVLKKELTTIKQKLFDFQMERFTQFINERGKVENLPAEEEKLQREMTELHLRIDRMIGKE
jgi:hypothetical protein